MVRWQHLVHHPEGERLLGGQLLPGQKKIAPPVGPQKQRPDQMDAVTRHNPVWKMRSVLKRCGLGRQHDIAQHGDLRMDEGRPVDCGYHRHGNIEQIHQQALALPIHGVPAARRTQAVAKTGKINIRAIAVARSGQNNDFILRVGSDINAGMADFAVGRFIPDQRAIVDVKGDFENAVAPLHFHCFVLIGIIFKLAHLTPPAFFYILF